MSVQVTCGHGHVHMAPLGQPLVPSLPSFLSRQGLEFFLDRDLVRMAGQHSGILPCEGITSITAIPGLSTGVLGTELRSAYLC